MLNDKRIKSCSTTALTVACSLCLRSGILSALIRGPLQPRNDSSSRSEDDTRSDKCDKWRLCNIRCSIKIVHLWLIWCHIVRSRDVQFRVVFSRPKWLKCFSIILSKFLCVCICISYLRPSSSSGIWGPRLTDTKNLEGLAASRW